MNTPLLLLLTALTTYRLTRLITADQITEPLRVWADLRGERIGYLFSCDWCLSVWVSVPMGFAFVYAGEADWFRVLVVSGSVTAFAGLLAGAEKKLS